MLELLSQLGFLSISIDMKKLMPIFGLLGVLLAGDFLALVNLATYGDLSFTNAVAMIVSLPDAIFSS